MVLQQEEEYMLSLKYWQDIKRCPGIPIWQSVDNNVYLSIISMEVSNNSEDRLWRTECWNSSNECLLNL